MGLLDRLLGRGDAARSASGRNDAIYQSVRCNACGEVIRARVNPTSELSLQEDGTYYVRKVLVGQQCYRPIEVQLYFKEARVGAVPVDRQAHGGTFVEDDASA